MKKPALYIVSISLLGLFVCSPLVAFALDYNESDNPSKTSAIQSFNAVIESQSVRLSWDVRSLEGIEGFEIQRATLRNGSMSSIDWKTIGTLPVTKGASASYYFEYHDMDAQSAAPIAVYRIKQTSGDGAAFTSAMKIHLRGATAFELHSVYPNPVSASSSPVVQYRVASPEVVSIALYDATGRELRIAINAYHNAGEYSLPLNVTNLAPGLYFVSLSSESTNIMQRLVVAR